MHRSVDRMLNQEAAFTASLIRSFSCGPTSWLLLPRQTGLFLRFTDEAHCERCASRRCRRPGRRRPRGRPLNYNSFQIELVQPTSITSKPASFAAAPSRSSAQMNGRFRGRSLHQIKAAASWKASNARKPCRSGKVAARSSTRCDGGILRPRCDIANHLFTAISKSLSTNSPVRLNRANELRISTAVPHQMVLIETSRCICLAAAVVACITQRGTTALVSQNAISVFISLFDDNFYCSISRNIRQIVEEIVRQRFVGLR